MAPTRKTHKKAVQQRGMGCQARRKRPCVTPCQQRGKGRSHRGGLATGWWSSGVPGRGRIVHMDQWQPYKDATIKAAYEKKMRGQGRRYRARRRRGRGSKRGGIIFAPIIAALAAAAPVVAKAVGLGAAGAAASYGVKKALDAVGGK